MYTFGQKLDYLTIWAGGQDGVYRAWFSGIRFCRYEVGRNTALVFTKFFGKWIKVRYDLSDIRPAKLKKGQCESLGLTDIIGRPI